MIVINPNYPEHYLEFVEYEGGRAVGTVTDFPSTFVLVEYAATVGYTPNPIDPSTRRSGTFFNVAFTKDVEPEVDEDGDVTLEGEGTTQSVEDFTEDASSTEDVKAIEPVPGVEVKVDFEELAALDNTKENRKKIDEIAEGLEIRLNRQKFQTVAKLVAEFERLVNERKEQD